jgi:branched-chain amino acid aminotransferase
LPVPQAADEAFAAGAAFIEGEYLPVGEARLPLLDWGFIKSDCAYDVVGVWGGRFFRLDDHVERFHTSMERLHLVCPNGRYEIAAVLHDCVRLAGLRDSYVEMITTRGLAPAGSRELYWAAHEDPKYTTPVNYREAAVETG